jgi:hypothetical protein
MIQSQATTQVDRRYLYVKSIHRYSIGALKLWTTPQKTTGSKCLQKCIKVKEVYLSAFCVRYPLGTERGRTKQNWRSYVTQEQGLHRFVLHSQPIHSLSRSVILIFRVSDPCEGYACYNYYYYYGHCPWAANAVCKLIRIFINLFSNVNYLNWVTF